MPTIPTCFPTVNTVNESFRDHMKISNPSFHEYYGTYERFTNNDFEKLAVFVIPGNGVGMEQCLTMDDWIDFSNRYRGIKNLIIDIREAWQQKDKPIQTFKYVISAQWIPSTNTFIHWYGMAVVPYNVRFALLTLGAMLVYSLVPCPPSSC